VDPTIGRIPARDGFGLAASVYEGAGGARPEAVVLVSSATAVRRRYYDRFARFLAGEGFAVVTYDYRGIGDSRPAELRGFPAAMHEWGEKDLSGVIDWVDATWPDAPLLVVGHSAGGQVVGLAESNTRVGALLGVAAQSGHWRLWPAPRRYRMALLWYGVVPALTRLVGYLPRWAGIAEDLPAGVALEWAKWCRTPGYLAGGDGEVRRAGFARLTCPVRAYSFADDPYAPRAAVDALLDLYASAPREHRHLAPADLDVPAIGHFGFFRESFRDTLWREAADWLRQRAGHAPVTRPGYTAG
jgi:predicted alpha/beta hydrolase